jgi:hypothetical protein
VRDLTLGTTTLVSINSAGGNSGNGSSVLPVISADGRFVAFTSLASDLVATDTNGHNDVFVRDLQTGTTTLASVKGAGLDSGNAASWRPVISADGRFVAFESSASDLVDTDTNARADVFVAKVDIDGDGIANAVDNCPLIYNPDQADRDGDGIGDACDNCPDVANPPSNWYDINGIPHTDEQPDFDLDGLGDACEDFAETLVVPATARPGDTIWVTATFKNQTGQSIQTICPDCFNTTFTVRDSLGKPLPPTYRIRMAYGIPTDVVTIPPGDFSVICDLSEMFHSTVLTVGSYTVEATYSNYIEDPDYDPGTGGCAAPPCYDLWIGAVSSGTGPVTIVAGPDVVKKAADVNFDPPQWDVAWTSGNSPPIYAHISNIVGHNVNEVDTSTILLNGEVSIIPGSAIEANGILTVQFDRSLAVQSLGTVVPGTYYPIVQGELNGPPEEPKLMYGKGRVEIVEHTCSVLVQADKHEVGCGSYPGSSKYPIVGMVIKVFDKSEGSCAAGYGISWHHYPEIWNGYNGNLACEPVAETTTNPDGQAIFVLPGGDYIVIGEYTEEDPPLYIGRSVGDCAAGSEVKKYLQVITKCDGKKVPAKYRKLEGSELLIIEPEYVEWSAESELYPFVFESIGDWAVSTSVAPPEGFVADYDSLAEEVNTELEAVQFTITDVGSKWKPTKVKYQIKHKGKREKVESEIGVMLTPELAMEKGVSVYGEEDKDKDIDKDKD